MSKRSYFKLPVFLLLFLIAACSTENKDNYAIPENSTFSVSEVNERFQLKDDLATLSLVSKVEFVDDNRMIITDNTPAIYLFENYEMKKIIGRSGKGPCEFETISATELDGDILHVLDSNQRKLISYDLNTQECVAEYDNPLFAGSDYLYKHENGEFITGRTSYTFLNPDSTKLAFRLTEENEMEGLDFELSRINPVKTLITFRSGGLDFKKSGDKLYGYYPLTDSVYVIDLNDYSVSSLPLDIDIKRKEFEDAGEDMNKVMEIIQGDFEFLDRLFVSDNFLAAMVLSNPSTEGDMKRSLHFYSKDGRFLYELDYPNQIIDIQGNTIVEVEESLDPNSDYSFSLVYRDLIIE